MAFETEMGNVTKPDAAISAIAAPAFVESSKALQHGYIIQLPSIQTVKFNKDGSFTAEIQTESGAYTFDSGDEFSQSAVSCTAQTYLHITKPTVQAERFTDGQFDDAKRAKLQGEALARKFDATFFALFSSITNTVTASTILTKDNLIDAQYTVHNAMNMDRKLNVMLARKGRNEIRKELTNTTASAFTLDVNLQLFNGSISPAGYVGEFSDMSVYNTSGLPTTGSDNVQAVYDPQYAFGIAIDQMIRTRSVFVASGGMWTEIASWMFANACLWNDTAACKLRSDS